ncbi:2-polyprenyl-6-methoxyphenol hydroxylase-like FAD-dependent oxidoreductase [Pantoea sp. AG1095]|uniref:FAD-dependent oxidoreductase n=1 Tax=Pantoea sp. AG1095 TaxID=2184004 RepID=UPI000D8C993F|nr:FAD-dependent oxidoreductase [Pantoea sp. AG1095]PYG49668.1 2-polyprenyl-6-methoxyphenol hydroxylase-like FAD-dependent oxidoreductase [Pantoea sp. AG1095]
MQVAQENAISADCCIVGGGPAGLMLGYLLARAGLRAVVIEKHPDFLRDFRGDTIHPSTLEIMRQLGLLDELLTLPHQRAEKLQAEVAGEEITMADFSRLPVECRFIAFMPQWDFLNFLAKKAAEFPGFTLLQSTAFDDFIYENGVISGVKTLQGNEPHIIRTALVIGADGRNSQVKAKAGLTGKSFGAPRDVLWFRLEKHPDDPQLGMGHKGPKQNFIVIDRGDYWQCGYTIQKNQFDELKLAGLDALKSAMAQVAPFSAERMAEVDGWDKLKLLSIRIDRLDRWMKPGVLCIGDAAHAMSPIGGVGVNLAIQDAVAAANMLTKPLQQGNVALHHLQKVQQRRQFPTVATQFLQIKMSSNKRKRSTPSKVPQIISRFPFLRHLFGRLIGLGFRTEKPRYL